MFHSILNKYLEIDTASPAKPLEARSMSPDCDLYLCSHKGTLYVLVETDYLTNMPGIVKDAEQAFGVTVEGWCVLKKHQQAAGRPLLPRDSDDYDPDGTNEANHNNFVYAVLRSDDRRYAVLRATRLHHTT